MIFMDALITLGQYLPLALVFLASVFLPLALAAFVEGELLIGSIDLILGIGSIGLLGGMTVNTESTNIHEIGKDVRYYRKVSL